MDIRYEWRGEFSDEALNALHADGFDHDVREDNWNRQVREHSLGWVCAYSADHLVGFVNVAWDGAFHAFLLDTLVGSNMRRSGIDTQLVVIAAQHARGAGCEWLHVDFDSELTDFYFKACGFESTDAGLIAL